ncbi:hypothetical protein BH18ACT6_BH18ACT6_11590 [soil metagenome]
MRKSLAAFGLLFITGTASLDPIAAGLAEDGFYLEDGVDATTAEMEDLVARFRDFYFVGLADEVPGGVQAMAEDLVDVLGDGTVVVLTPEEVWAVSLDFNDETMEAAFSDAQFGGSYAADFEAFATQLSGPSDVPSESGGISWVPILIGVGIVGLVGFAIWRGGRRSKQASENLLTEARTEIRQQMDVIASQIVDLADDPRVESSAGAEDHYRQASETFQTAEGRLVAAQALPALEDLSDDLDRARWQLDATQALIEGKSPPPEPQPEAPISCFFDPTHGAGREQTTLETAAGNKVVMVCDNCAERLRRGEIPDPRQIPYRGRPIPAPQAPRSHGGQGMDWLDLFSVLVGGMGSARSYDWSRTTGLPSRGRVSSPPLGGSRGSVGGRRGSGSRGKVSGSRKRG